MRWVLIFLGLLPVCLMAADGSAADLVSELNEASLDVQECYRVRDLNFSREDVRFYLTDGYLIFAKPIAGTRVAAVFTAEVEGGDAEILVFPPNRSERFSLAAATGSPNLNEHFKIALMFFTDDTGDVLYREIRENGPTRKSPEMGVLLAGAWDSVVRNVLSGLEVRLVNDLLTARPNPAGIFYGAFQGEERGNFDVIYDLRAPEQVTLGQAGVRDGEAHFQYWASFQSRSFRNGTRQSPPRAFSLSDFRVDATLEPDLRLRATTRVTLTPTHNGLRSLAFEISPRMQVTAASLDAKPVGVYQRESVRARVSGDGDNETFLLLLEDELEADRPYEIEFHHQGSVVSSVGNRVYFVGARGSWYPNSPPQFAQYDLTFHYPKDLDLVSSGQVVEDRAEGDLRVTRRKTSTPIRQAGFNLGDYVHVRIPRGEYTVEVAANRRVETALEPAPKGEVRVNVPTLNQRRVLPIPSDTLIFPGARPPSPDPTARLQQMGTEIADAFEFMVQHFGAPPSSTLTVSPIPGGFGQGYAGLVYLSTLAYLNPEKGPLASSSDIQRLFYTEIMQAHETAHQWWGNVVTGESYRDEWLMEALANYSALLYYETRKGPEALKFLLNGYRDNLLAKNSEGLTRESAGPIVWGARLRSSHSEEAWRVITYEKGSWIIHMLRRRLGDERFLDMLGELRKRYEFRSLNTEQFQQLVAEFLPPGSADPKLENFFANWVYGTGIPTMRLTYSIGGTPSNVRLEGSLAQTEVPSEFETEVPIEIRFAKREPVTLWMKTGGGTSSFSRQLKEKPVSVVMDPHDSVLAVQR